MVSAIDITIVVVYLLIMLGVGYLSGKNNKTQDDYFLAGHSMPWIPVALSVAATMISANGFIGGPGWAYTSGMAPVMVNITVPLAVCFALSITTPVFYRMKVTSVYEYMGKRMGKYTRALTILQFFINSIIQISSMIYIPVLIFQKITGISFYVLVPFVVITALLYTLMGGIKAVIWTDSIQMVVVIGSVILIMYMAVKGCGLSLLDTLSVAKESGRLNTLDFSLDITKENTFWASLIGGSVMWIRYFCFDQSQVQRVLTSKSLKSAKNSFVVSVFVMNIVYYVMLLLGAILFVFYGGKEFATSNEIMITFIIEQMPIGIIGIIIAGIFAVAMSSIDSLLNSMTAVFTKDIYEPCVKKEASLKVTMIITGCIGVIMTIVIFVAFNGSVKSILDLVGSYISYFAGPAAGAFILAMFTKKANDKGTAVGVIIGFVLGWIIAIKFQVNWLWNPIIGAIITIAFGYILSLLWNQNSNEEQAEKYTALGIRQQVLANESDKGDVPFSFGCCERIVLVFFIMQYVFLYCVQH